MSELLRWIGAGSAALVVTLMLFIGMTRMVDGTAILESVMRIFPLTFAPLTPEDECALPLPSAVTIEGFVGHYHEGIFVPRADAEAVSDDALGGARRVEVAPDGAFRFVTAFPNEAPSDCPLADEPTPATAQRLLLRAPGCRERKIPVTRAWVPHRVALVCD